jgi:hypothetical protein
MVLLAGLASEADVIISNEADCVGRDAGVACASWNLRGPSVCTPSTCSRKDFREGLPAKRTEVACLRCLPNVSDAGTPVGYGTGKKRSAP